MSQLSSIYMFLMYLHDLMGKTPASHAEGPRLEYGSTECTFLTYISNPSQLEDNQNFVDIKHRSVVKNVSGLHL